MLNNYEHRRGHDTERRGVDGNAQSRADSNSWAAQNLTLGGSLGVQKPTKKKNKKIAIQSGKCTSTIDKFFRTADYGDAR